MNKEYIFNRMGDILLECLRKGNKQIVELLIYNGANIETKKYQIMKYLIELDYINLIKHIIDNNIVFNINDDNYVDLLKKSIKYKKIDIAKYLITLKKNNGDYMFDISNGQAFLLSHECNNIELIELFVNRGINLNKY